MANKEFQLKSGASLVVTSAPFADAHALLKALLSAARGIPLSQRNPLEEDVSVLKDALLAAATSQDVDAGLFKCFQRTSYDGQKITRDLFDDPKIGDKARGDFYEIAWHVIEVNCVPFFGQAFSLLRDRLKTQAVSQRSESTSTRP